VAKPCLDTRENEIHTRISVELALRLLESEGGSPEVVLPAVILHDVEGVKIARELLAKTFYDLSPTREILAIIEGHGSRSRALSKNDAGPEK
jgi:HD superfamily phosphodiesterase